MGDRRFVPEPVVEWREVSGACLEEQALGPGMRVLDGDPERVGEVGVPPEGLATDAGAVTREPGDDRHHAVLPVDAEHGHRVVDRAPRIHAVDGDSGGPPDAGPDRRRLPPDVRPVHGSREPVWQRRGVALEAGGAHGGPHAVRLEQHGRAVVVGGVQEHGVRGDPGQLRDPPPRSLGDVPGHPEEIGGHERDPAAAVVEHQGLGEQRLVHTVGAAGPEPPRPGLDAERRRDVDAADASSKTAHARSSSANRAAAGIRLSGSRAGPIRARAPASRPRGVCYPTGSRYVARPIPEPLKGAQIRMADLPRTADVVVVGGGVHGASVAYHLARRRAGRVVLVERKFLASGPTGRSSALVRRFYAMDFLTRTGNASAQLFQRWAEAIGGGDPGIPSGGDPVARRPGSGGEPRGERAARARPGRPD